MKFQENESHPSHLIQVASQVKTEQYYDHDLEQILTGENQVQTSYFQEKCPFNHRWGKIIRVMFLIQN